MAIYKPFPYQKKAEDFIIDHSEAGLFLDMGLGKTVITLSALAKLKWEVKKVLVVAPKLPALDTWPCELKKWEHLKGITFSEVKGGPKERRAALSKKAYIYIISRDNIAWLVNEGHWDFDCLVLDELSSYKSTKSQRFRALKKVRKNVDRVIGLTGTPAANGYLDLWPEVFLLDGGKALGKTFTGFKDMYFKPGRRNGHIVYEWILKKGARDKIFKNLAPFCMSMKTEDYLDLPPRLDIVKSVELSQKTKSLYKKFQNEWFIDAKGKEIDAVNAAVLVGKLLQVSSGAVYDNDKTPVLLHDEKLEALDSIIEEANGNVFIFYTYAHELERLKKRYPEAVDVREPGARERWNNGEIKILLGHPASAGHGLNLQFGGSVTIWLGLSPSLELYQQACKRLHRTGQTQTVRNYIILAKDTFDEVVYYQILGKKRKAQDVLLEVLKHA